MVICRYGELFLKGRNRGHFENVLIKNIILSMNANSANGSVKLSRGRIIISTDYDIFDAIRAESFEFLRRVFGLVSFSYALKSGNSVEEITENSLKLMQHKKFDTFKVASQRITKTGKLNSLALNEEIGARLISKAHKKVKLKMPEVEVGVEILEDEAYTFLDSFDCVGGLPCGSGEIVGVVYASNIPTKNSTLAALMMMKRGFRVVSLIAGLNKSPNNPLLGKFFPVKAIQIGPESANGADGNPYKIPQDEISAVIFTGEAEEYNLKFGSIFKKPMLNPLASMSEPEISGVYKKYENFC